MNSKNRQKQIVEMFDNIAPTYDKTNRLLSMGIDISWRKSACDETYKRYKKDIDLIVDVACGTGDMMGYWKKQANKINRKIGKLVGVDPSCEMIKVAKKKFVQFEFIIGDAGTIPLKDKSADILSISYGIRNVIERKDAFKEFARVLKTGGYLVILEFTKDDKKGFFFKIKEFYINKLLPKIGGFISKNRDAYEYLPNSIDGFLTAKMIEKELDDTGFSTEFVKSFSMNISTLIIAKKR
ncbi:MAG: bifunctional demethylmenaquinone methyltransferase/2-methoxy-6-polyprenyl-1,4-benzoquinol methylase UbiE [Sulfurospirillum sp.]|nr:bifunctional demethylmenaquinone methyltransferase/2-methoxy-6-polyprenyl-1,4-benzoquinol methylase UbiE [Sulfurospirillum sp.]MBL0703004.1 bifunctional demethylmenaquinone methyltransferase/2-methoxy-6-polyprenyl-1,4-benzoquinol methylase UbiE [Sulfurospirillum sp.]